MEKHIIEDFKKDYPGISFPYWEEISGDEAKFIIDKLFANLDIEYSNGKMLEGLYDGMIEHPDSPIEYDSIAFEAIIDSIGISKPEQIYINWHRFETLDRMNLEDFSKYLFDIWYGYDDLEIISGNLDWVVALTHYDVIKYKKSQTACESISHVSL